MYIRPLAMTNKPWNREETIIAFNAYCKIPFKDCSKMHLLVIEYAKLIGRSPSALNMKIGNIGRLDPDLRAKGVTGLAHGAKLEQDIWDEFYDDPERLSYESEKLIAKFSGQNIAVSASQQTSKLPLGQERQAYVKQRVNQSFFRAAVMSAYNFRCCISGIANPMLLEACHIVDWSEDEKNRTNPKNGLCLNAFFHKAYDSHLLGITPDLQIVVSEELLHNATEKSFRRYLDEINKRKIMLPDRFLPQRELLDIHYKKFLNT